MLDYSKKTSVINLNEFTLEGINYFGWESNFPIRPSRFLKYCLQSFNEHKPVRET